MSLPNFNRDMKTEVSIEPSQRSALRVYRQLSSYRTPSRPLIYLWQMALIKGRKNPPVTALCRQHQL